MTEEKIIQARKFFLGDYNCAQSVMKAVLLESGINIMPEQIARITAGFGGGMAHEGQVCGAVSGAIAAIGLILGRSLHDVKEHKETTYFVSENFIQKFKKRHGSIICNNLTGIDIKDKDQRENALQDGLFYRKCPAYVEDAVEITLKLTGEF